MRILRTIREVRAAIREARAAGGTIGLVPTMGAFHDGHLSLMRTAREASDLVVVSLFVNPTQFGANEDLSAYPRDEARDAGLAEAAGVDILFAPTASEIYPDGFATNIHVAGLTDVLDGASRGVHHFDGVATVVTKLFGIVRPDAAYFGQKDAQQVLVVRRVVRDLDLDVRIVACPIVREADGLAMSSRNVYLDAEARVQASALNRALDAGAAVFETGDPNAGSILSTARRVLADAGIDPEYLELRDAETLRPLARVDRDALLAVAAHIGAARLIDNHVLHVADAAATTDTEVSA
ncbi:MULTISPECIES: pantoate--beta-alanine ligase [unclassified Microbacterium]|uniref:pantoate--beta-alanine ligase n=1 Tax=unclassified Microbacterium TaxID=2609290 RepID=UPI000DE1EBC3|nr:MULTISPECIES: pantoate--beta-alanine ligase [unclassified Microbacterium]NYF29335.1 pantoate--beta-alanine ligase [Microbacterium sp. JAI119]RBO73941.1 pantoate--beta-alanine ligase [Microbacterium sp. H6]